MKPQYVTYTRFHRPEEAQFLVTLLQQHGIPYTMEHEVNQLDKICIGELAEPMFALNIPGHRFNDTHALLAQQAKNDMAQPGFEHYLQSYTIAELQEILDRPEGWNAYDMQVATALLTDKAAAGTTVMVNDAITYVPIRLERIWIFLGYFVSLLAFTHLTLLGAAGFFSGLAITQSKTTLKNGDIVKTYAIQDIRSGRRMMVFSGVCMIAGVILLFERL